MQRVHTTQIPGDGPRWDHLDADGSPPDLLLPKSGADGSPIGQIPNSDADWLTNGLIPKTQMLMANHAWELHAPQIPLATRGTYTQHGCRWLTTELIPDWDADG